MTKVLINNSEQYLVEQRLIVNQLTENGYPGMGKALGKSWVGKAAKGMKKIETQGKATMIQAKRGGLRAKKAMSTPGFKAAAIGGTAGAAAGMAVKGRRKNK